MLIFPNQPPQIMLFSHNDNYELDCDDCDCPKTSPQVMAFIPPFTGLYQTDFQQITLNESYAICYNQKYNTQAVLNHSALHLLARYQQPHPLEAQAAPYLKTILQQALHLGFLTSTESNLPTTESPTTLTAWLHITDRCNLRCAYCYLPHHKVDMNLETGQASIAATFRSALKHHYKTIKLKYAGGEAMLRFPLIVQLHCYAQQLAEQHGLTVEGVILSNGTLLKADIIEQMQSLGLKLMISLDGLGQYQDQQRFYASGKGTSTDVTQSIQLALAHGLVPYISVTVTGQSAAGLPEVMAWVLAHDLPFSLNFYRENDHSASYTELKLEEAAIINGMVAAFKVIEENLPRRSLLASLVDRANLAAPHLQTCGVGQNYLVFDHHGNVSKCQMHQQHAVTTMQADDPLAFIRADQIGIQNLSVEVKEGCRDCEWKYWCTGGCPVATYRATGRYDVQSPNCNIYKALYPAAIRLEGLRLLKYLT